MDCSWIRHSQATAPIVQQYDARNDVHCSHKLGSTQVVVERCILGDVAPWARVRVLLEDLNSIPAESGKCLQRCRVKSVAKAEYENQSRTAFVIQLGFTMAAEDAKTYSLHSLKYCIITSKVSN